jgi:hypothetical protein
MAAAAATAMVNRCVMHAMTDDAMGVVRPAAAR